MRSSGWRLPSSVGPEMPDCGELPGKTSCFLSEDPPHADTTKLLSQSADTPLSSGLWLALVMQGKNLPTFRGILPIQSVSLSYLVT